MILRLSRGPSERRVRHAAGARWKVRNNTFTHSPGLWSIINRTTERPFRQLRTTVFATVIKSPHRARAPKSWLLRSGRFGFVRSSSDLTTDKMVTSLMSVVGLMMFVSHGAGYFIGGGGGVEAHIMDFDRE